MLVALVVCCHCALLFPNVAEVGKSGGWCRVWWALRVHGFTEAYVLDGGWRGWVAAGGAEELSEPCPLKVFPLSQ
jgi:3-mercaptopyruvate sulfurtransferase SseA